MEKEQGKTLDFNDLYDKTMEEVKSGIRPTLSLGHQELGDLKEFWQSKYLEFGFDPVFYKKMLFLLFYNGQLLPLFNENILEVIDKETIDSDLHILSLNVLVKHHVEYSMREGDGFSSAFLEMMEKSLGSPASSEHFYWLVKTVDMMGPRGHRRLKMQLEKNRPGILSYFNSHKMKARQLINEMKARWEARDGRIPKEETEKTREHGPKG